VNSTDGLIAALKAAHGGDAILLAAGTYDSAWLSNFNFSTSVAIRSADAAHQAVINNLQLNSSSGLVFSQLHFATVTDIAATVASSHNITFSNDTFQGATTGTGNGMLIRDSDGVTVTGSDFSKFWSGINEVSASNLTITKNTFHGLSDAAIRGTGATYETISGNTFADANPSLASHTDTIYLWQDNVANHVTIGANTYGAPVASVPAAPTTGSTGQGDTVTVSTTKELANALKHAHGGETILLKAGTYDAVAVDNFNFATAVTIQSADPSHEAVINNLEVVKTSNVVFNQLNITTTTGTAATVASSHNITFSNDVFHGHAVGTGNAMLIRDSDGIMVTGSDVGKLWAGVNEVDSSNLTITNNTFHDLQDAGVRGTGATHETISGNTFADANPSLASHGDAINLWQDNTANHVTITNNIYGSGASATTPPAVTTSPPAVTTPSPPASTSGADTSTGAATSPSAPTSTPTHPVTETGGTVTVSNATELWNALKSAHGGETILLNAGTYDNVGIYGVNINGTVTIQSADSTHQALINNLDIEGSSGIAVKGVNVEASGTSNYAVSVGSSSHISLDSLTIHGTSATYDGVGVFVNGSNDVSLTNSDISQLGCGVAHMEDVGLTIANNSIHDLGADGIIGGGSSHVVVSGNTLTNFNPPDGSHPDAIQFFGGATAGETGNDVLIANNVISRGDGAIIQGIFIEATNNLTITGNAMAGTMYNGISVSASSHALIDGNFVGAYTDMGSGIVTRGGSADVVVVNNAAGSVTDYTGDGVNPNYVQADNTTIGASAVGDTTALKAWLAQHAGVTAALVGGQGDDFITGTTGADNMSGGLGNDAYTVNNAGDMVTESLHGGVDTVNSSLTTYTLGANVENLVLGGTTAQTGVGNDLDNVMTGNGVQSVLNGGAGNDTLVAMGGATTLTGGAGSDVFSIGATPTSAVQITDFTAGQDKLDLHTLLANYHGTDPVADQWVQFQSSSSGVTVLVDADGPSGAAGYVAVAKLAGVTSLAASDWVFH
jgi:Ca2+-binding RTX toxin-like protein